LIDALTVAAEMPLPVWLPSSLISYRPAQNKLVMLSIILRIART